MRHNRAIDNMSESNQGQTSEAQFIASFQAQQERKEFPYLKSADSNDTIVQHSEFSTYPFF